MVSRRARATNSLTTRLSAMQADIESTEAKTRGTGGDDLASRLEVVERQLELLNSSNFRADQEQDIWDNRYRVASNLGAVDLDTILTPGTYVQRTNANATFANHYPFERAGFLEVISNNPANNVGLLQRYTDYQVTTVASAKGVWVRAWYNSWGAWMRIDHARNSGWTTLSSYFLDGTVSGNTDGFNAMLRGSTGTDVATGTSSIDITSTPLPAEWRPTGNSWGSGYSAGVSLTALLRPDGTIALSNRNSIALTGTIFFSISYILV